MIVGVGSREGEVELAEVMKEEVVQIRICEVGERMRKVIRV